MGKRLSVFGRLFLLAALLFTGCNTPPGAANERPPLRVEYTTWEGDYTMLIAQEKGFFAKHGVNVEPVFYEIFSASISDLAARRIDGGLFGIGDLLLAANIANMKAVAVYDSGIVSTVVARPEIQTIEDLRFKKIGVTMAGSGELVVREMLKSVGLTMREVSLVHVEPEMVSQRLSEDIHAGYVWAPYDRNALSEGNKVIYSRGSSYSLLPDVIVFHGDVVKQRPEDVRAFVAAWFEAVDYRLANPQESNEIIARLTNQSVEDVASDGTLKLYTREDNHQLFQQANGEQSSIYSTTKANLDFFISHGSVTIPPNLNVILDSSYLP